MFDLYELCTLVVFSVIEIRGSENAIKAIETLHKTEINGRDHCSGGEYTVPQNSSGVRVYYNLL